MTEPPDESAIRGRLIAGDVDAAAALAIRRYGPELHGYLRAIARDDDLAAEAFAIASEQLWANLARFRWEATLRTWAYRLARNALHQLRAAPNRRLQRNLPLSIAPSIEHVLRSQTAPFQRTSVKDAMRALRESLDADDHELLLLRLDRSMSWRDIARALADDDAAPSEIDQRAAALRKRYERIKERLKQLAIEKGLIE